MTANTTHTGKVSEASDKSEESEDTRTLKEKILSELKFLVGLFIFLIFFWTTIFGHYKIPSESMQPTLEVGDHLYVSKFAYGYSKHSLPLALHNLPLPEGRIFSRLPKRGDVAVFRHPYQKIVMIKRVVGLPGDTVRVNNGRLYINDQIIDRIPIDQREYYTFEKRYDVDVTVYEEQFSEESEPHIIYERSDGESYDRTEKFIVPADTVFFMGDNRDGSADSRAEVRPSNPEISGPGFVHKDYLIGRADLIMFSLYKCRQPENYHCAKKRFFSKIK